MSTGDEINLDYRARLVGREITTNQRPDLCVFTTGVEFLRVIVSICASNQHCNELCGILSSDIKRVYSFAKATRPIFIEIPVEDGELGDENMIGRFNLSLYDTRDAAMNWQDEFSNALVNHGFTRGRACQCNLHHAQRQLVVAIHDDDFMSTGPKQQLKWFKDKTRSMSASTIDWDLTKMKKNQSGF